MNLVTVARVCGPALLAAIAVAPCRSQALSPPGGPSAAATARALGAALLPNAGQWPEHVRFATTGRARLWIERDAIVTAAPAADGMEQVFRLRLLEVDAASVPRGESALSGPHHFLRGADPAGWHRDLTAHRRVRWTALQPGVDLVVDMSGEGPEYVLDLAPGVLPSTVLMRCEGAQRLELLGDGSLCCRGEARDLVQSPPRAWRCGAAGQRVDVPVAFQLVDATTFTFVAPAAPGERLCIDPVLQWATFVGGSAYEWGHSVWREPDGTVLVVGETTSANFPTTAGVFDPTYNGFGPPTSDAFIVRLNAAGTGVVYATYLGGSGADKALAVCGDGTGVATVAGAAGSTNFPTTPGAYDTTLGGASDAFVARLSGDGSTLLFATLLGGAGDDLAEAVATNGSGEAWIAGVTSSPAFPTTAGAHSSARQGNSDAYVARIAANGSQLLASTLLGGGDGEVAKGVAVGPANTAVVGGVTSSSDFPTTPGAFQPALLGTSDAFVARVSSGCQLLAASLIGGSGGDVGEAVAIAPGGLALLAGVTSSSTFPVTPGVFQSAPAGASDGFVAGFDGVCQRRWATLVGGNGGDVAKGVSATAAGTVVVGGQCSSSVFPTSPGAVLAAGSGSSDAFVVHLAADGSGMLAGTLFGGSGADGGESLDGRDGAAVALTGVANSGNLPVTPGAWSASQLGTNDAFAAVLDLRPAGVVRYGTSTPSCLGAVGVSVTRWPAAGAADFALACTQAPPLTFGVLAIGIASWPGVPVVGVTAWVDITQPVVLATVVSDDLGFTRVPLPLTGVTPGALFYAQFAWFHPPNCGVPWSLAASDALEVLVQ